MTRFEMTALSRALSLLTTLRLPVWLPVLLATGLLICPQTARADAPPPIEPRSTLPEGVDDYVLTSVMSLDWSGSGVFLVHAADFDGDGDSDVLVAGGVYPPAAAAGVPLLVLENIGANTFRENTSGFIDGAVPARVHPAASVVADFNNDGQPDVFLACKGYDSSPWPGETNVLLLSENGKLVDKSGTLPQLADVTASAATGDVNGDTFPDLYVGNIHGQGGHTPYMLVNNGGGGFTKADTPDQDLPQQLLSSAVLGAYTASAMHDFDGQDGDDLALGASDIGADYDTSIHYRTAAGNLTLASRDAVAYAPLGSGDTVSVFALVLDVDLDGDAELLLSQTRADPAYAGRAVQVVEWFAMGASDSSWRFGGSEDVDGEWVRVLIALDFEDDGDTDVFYQGVGGDDATTPVVWLNNGTGQFGPLTREAFPAVPWYEFTNMTPLDAPAEASGGPVDFLTLWMDESSTRLSYRTVTTRPGITGWGEAAPAESPGCRLAPGAGFGVEAMLLGGALLWAAIRRLHRGFSPRR